MRPVSIESRLFWAEQGKSQYLHYRVVYGLRLLRHGLSGMEVAG